MTGTGSNYYLVYAALCLRINALDAYAHILLGLILRMLYFFF